MRQLMPVILPQVWLQEFAWTEEEKERKVASRNSSIPEGVQSELLAEPMFCVATMMKALYWSLLIYDFQVHSTPLPVPPPNL